MKSGVLRTLSLGVAVLLFVFVVTATASAQTAPSALVRSGCELDYPPFCIVHDDGSVDGFSVELLIAALEKMGREVTFETGPWAEVRGWLERGEVDALPLVGRTPEREELFDFTVPYLTMHGAIVVRSETAGIRTLDDLRDRTVGVMAGDNAEEFLRREPRDFEVVTLPTFADAFRSLADGGCDAVVIQRLVAVRLIEELDLSSELRVVDQPILGFSQDFCFAVTEGDHALLSVLNEGLALAMADGTHRRLYAKWFAHLQLPANRAIVVGGDANYPPFEYLDENGRPAGYNVDLIRAVAQAAGLTIEIRLGPWSEMMQALEDGEIDAMQGMFYSAARDASFDFSQAHIVNHCVAVVRKGEGPPPSTAEELAGRGIVVQEGDIMHAFAVEHGLDSALTAVASQEDALRELAAGTFDCALVARITALYWIDQHGWQNLEVGRTPLLSPEYCFAVPEGSGALLAELSEGLVAVEQAGEYRRIYEQWMGVYDPNLTARRTLMYAGIVAGVLAVILLLVLVWSWSLRRQVRRRTDQLRVSTEFQRAMVSCSPVALYSIDSNGRVLSWNESAERMFGWSAEETLGHPLPIVPDSDQEEFEALRQRVQTGESFTGKELKRRRRDGALIDVRLSAAPVLDERGDIVAIMGAAEDITERKQIERAMDRQRVMLARTERIAQIGSWEWDAETDAVLWSEEMFRLLGRDPAAGAPSLADHGQYFDAEEMDRLRAAVASAVANGTPYEMEVHARIGHGPLRTFMVRGYADTRGGSPIPRLFGSFQDITERKQAEWRIDHLNRVLRAIRDVNQLITHETDRDALLRRSCEILISTRGYRSAWVALHNAEGEVSLVAESGIGDDFDAVHDALAEGVWPPCALAAKEDAGGIAVIHNTDTNCTTCALSRSYRETAALAGTLRFADQEYGVLVVALPTQLADDAEERSLFKELVGDIAYALHALDLELQHGEATEALTESENKYRALFDQSTEAIYLHDLDGRILDVNKAACAQSGYSRAEWLGLTVFDGHPHASSVNLSQAEILDAWLAWEPGQQHVFESEHRRKDGTVYPVEVSSGIVRYGETPRVLAIVKDITERKRAETALHEQKTLLEAIYRNAPLVLMVVDAERRIQQVNGFAAQFAGRDAEDMLGLRGGEALRCLHALDDPRGCGFGDFCQQCVIRNTVVDTLETGKSHLHVEAPYVLSKDGENAQDMTLLLSATPLTLQGERKALVTLQDITQRKRAEEAVRESEEKYRKLVGNMKLGVVIAQADPVRLRFANPAMSDISGYEEEELLAMDERTLPVLIHPDDRHRFFTNFQKRIAGRDVPHQGEYRIVRKDGTTRWVSLYSSLIDYFGEKAALTSFVDITDRRRAEDERRAMEVQLRQAQKMESVGRLAGGVAHDFNNLLMGILNYVELCRDDIAPDHPSRRWLDEITREAERSATLTRQLLAFARKQTVAPQVLDLNETVENILAMLRRLIGEDIDLAWEPGGELWPVKIDPGQLDQILANLCVNARDAIRGVGKVTLETGNVSLSEDYCLQNAEATAGEYVMLAVSDDGCGMDRETLDNVFEPFFTTKNVGEGTGLGLATVYGIVKQNGGFVNVYSEPGEGTTFRIYLPRVAERGLPVEDGDGTAHVVGGDETILLVEDEASIRKTVGMLLERLGYTVLSAEDPDVAMSVAGDHAGPIHLLITDVVMPGMNGRDLAERLLATHSGMKVLYMSGYTANVIAHRGILDEGVHFLSKPISGDDLARTVRQLLDIG